MQKRPVFPSELARSASDRAVYAINSDRRIEVTHGRGSPRARPIQLLLRQVFVNLLSNAVKFTAKREIATIEVGSRIEAGEHGCTSSKTTAPASP